MKKLSSLLLAIAMAILMVACGDNSAVSDNTSVQETEPKVSVQPPETEVGDESADSDEPEREYTAEEKRIMYMLEQAQKEIDEAKANGTYVEPEPPEWEKTPPTADNLQTNPLSHIQITSEKVDGQWKPKAIITDYLRDYIYEQIPILAEYPQKFQEFAINANCIGFESGEGDDINEIITEITETITTYYKYKYDKNYGPAPEGHDEFVKEATATPSPSPRPATHFAEDVGYKVGDIVTGTTRDGSKNTLEYLGNDRWRDQNGHIWMSFIDTTNGEFRITSIFGG